MSFYAWNFACSPAVGYNDPLSVENLAMARLLLGNMSIRDSGILYWTDSSYVAQVGSLSNPFDGLFEPTDAGGGIVQIASGAAIVNGYLFISDDTENFDINSSPGNANATDRIVLRWTAATQTVALIRVNGPAGNTAPLTQTSTVWDTPIARVELDGSGDFSALIDDRRLAMPTGTVVKLDEFDGGAGGTVCTFNNIPPLFSNLRIYGVLRASRGAELRLQFNSDVGNNYSYSPIFGLNSVVGHAPVVGDTDIPFMAAGGSIDQRNTFSMDIYDYKNSDFHKTLSVNANGYGDGTTGAAGLRTFLVDGWWLDSAPITRIDFTLVTGTFANGTKIQLYGII